MPLDNQYHNALLARIFEVRAQQDRLRILEESLWDQYVEEAQSDCQTHEVAFEGHPAFLMDDPPSRPLA